MDTTKNQFSWLDLIPTPCLVQRLEDSQVVYINPAAYRVLDIPKSDWEGSQLTDLFTLGNKNSSGTWQRNGKRFHIQEQRIDLPETSYKQILIKPITPPISHKQLADAQRMASVLVHRLRSPLNGVIGFTEMVREAEQNNDTKASWDSIDKGLHSMKDLLDELNRFTEPIDVQPEKFNISQVIDQLASRLSGDQSRRLNITYNQQPAEVHGDPIHLQFIIKQLLDNAFEASEDELDRVEMRIDSSSLHITNQGNKLSQEERQQLFEPFFTTKARHLGLGLTQAWRYADALGWNLYYEGTTANADHTFTLQW